MSFSVRSWYSWFTLSALAALFLVLPSARAADLGGDWTVRFPVPTNANLYDVAANGTINVVAVGTRGAILTSSDLVSWAKISTGVKDDLVNVIWTGSKYAAVGVAGHVLTSPNGINWTVSNPGTSSDTLQCVAWTGSQLVVAGGYSTSTGFAGLVLTSPDGVTWQRRTFPTMGPIKRLVWTGAQLVGLLSGATASSIDGSAWAVHNLPAAAANGGTNTVSLVWTGTQLIVSGDTLWHSTNALSWSEYATALSGAVGVSLTWTGSELLVTNSNAQLFVSKDQLNFVEFSSSLPTSEISGTRYGSSLVMVGLGGHIDTQITDDSAAGTWTPRNTPAATLQCLDIAQSPSLVVGVGKGISWTSSDAGNTWAQHLLASSNNFQTVAWTGDKFVAGGAGVAAVTGSSPVAAISGIWTSTDGATWTAATGGLPADSAGNQVWYSVNWIGGKGYASGLNGTTGLVMSQTSTDGITWTAGGMASVALGIASDGAATPNLVAVGAAGAVMTSTNGTTWTNGKVALPTNVDFHDIAYGNGQFVAVTTGGTVWSSVTGSSWQQRLTTSVSLLGITRTGNEFIVVGSSGAVLRSFDGVYWRQADSSISQTLNHVLWNGTRLVAAGASANFITSDGTAATPPTLQFTTTSASMEEGGSVGLVITLSQAWTSSVTVPLSYVGSTAPASRYVAPASPVVFQPGETSKYIVIDSVDDSIPQPLQTIVVNLGTPTGGAVLATGTPPPTVNTITLSNDDVVPAFVVSPLDQLVTLNSPVIFTTEATSSPAYQWKKTGVAISGAKMASYSIAQATAASAGAYSVTATNAAGMTSSASDTGRLGVVTVQSITRVVKAGGSDSFTATAAGPAGVLSYQWLFNPVSQTGPVALVDSLNRISGSQTSKVTISALTAADSGTYTCVVTLGTGPSAPTLTATVVNYTVTDGLPVITAPAPLVTRVASAVDFTPVATNSPSKWTVTGLPPGLTFAAATGRITGKPTTSSGTAYTVKFTATNLYGTTPAIPGVTMSVTVNPLPVPTKGSFIVLLPRDPVSNANCGGRVDIKTTATGAFTGSLTMPLTPVAFSGVLSGAPNASPVGSVTIARKAPLAPVALSFSIDQTTGATSVTIAIAATATVPATNYTTTSPASMLPVAGAISAYNFSLTPDATTRSGRPQGDGYGRFAVPATGLVSVAGVLADGTSYSCSTYTASDSSIPIYAGLYSGGGSVVGSLGLNLDASSNYANNSISGPLSWFKAAHTGSTRSYYAGGIPLMILNSDGGRYTVPTGSAIVMNLTAGTANAVLAFNGGVGDPGHLAQASRNPSGNFTVVAPTQKATGAPVSQAFTTLVFTGGTGLFNGQFTLSDSVAGKAVTRTVLYYGVLIRPTGLPAMVGRGFFNLPELPAVTTSPLDSGEVTLSAAP